MIDLGFFCNYSIKFIELEGLAVGWNECKAKEEH